MKHRIRQQFSRYSSYYESHGFVQARVYQLLVDQITVSDPQRVLDLGCGPGHLTRQLWMRLNQPTMIAVDLSPEMVAMARKKYGGVADFRVGDAESLAIHERFDLIFSSSVGQWLQNLPETFQRWQSYLSNRGQLAIAVFGPATYRELAFVVNQVRERSVALPAQRFSDLQDYLSALRCFCDVTVQQYLMTIPFVSLRALLHTIKYTGTAPQTSHTSGLWTPRMFNKIERAYLDHCGQIKATYQVFCFVCR